MHLRALSLGTASPSAAAGLYDALGARIGGTPRGGETLVLVGGTMLTYRRDVAAPTRTVLGFLVPDMAVVGERLTAAGIEWSCESQGVIGFSDGNPCYAVESPQHDGVTLIAATLFVRDVSASAAWWAAAGLRTGRAETLGYQPPVSARHDGGAAVFLDRDLTLHIAAAGDGPVTAAMGLRIHVDDPAALDAAEAGLTALGSPVERSETELRTATPEGIAVALIMREGIAPDPT